MEEREDVGAQEEWGRGGWGWHVVYERRIHLKQ